MSSDTPEADGAAEKTTSISPERFAESALTARSRCSAPSSTSFEIVAGGTAIKLPCGKVSYHPLDVEHRFAACCGRYLEDDAERERLEALMRARR